MTLGPIGILMLDTRFPRPVGDIGNPASFSVPVLYRRVGNASAVQAVRGDADALLLPFIDAGRELVRGGVQIIGTSCGFLSLFEKPLREALDVTVVPSALSLVAGQEPHTGVLTIDAKALTERHLSAVGIDRPVAIGGLRPDGALASTVFEDRTSLDMDAVEAEMIDAARVLVGAHPHVTRIVFECTNMGPYADAVSRAVGRPVLTVIDALEGALHGG
jgi:hypothetical protein